MKGQINCLVSAWFSSLEKRLEQNGLENSYFILTWLEFTNQSIIAIIKDQGQDVAVIMDYFEEISGTKLWIHFIKLLSEKTIKTVSMSRLVTKPTKWLYTQRRLRSESSQCAQWIAEESDQNLRSALNEDPMFFHADSEDYDHTGRMSRLIWVFAGRTGHIVDLVMRRFNYVVDYVLYRKRILMFLFTRYPRLCKKLRREKTYKVRANVKKFNIQHQR